MKERVKPPSGERSQRWVRIKRRAGWPIAAFGAALFLYGQIGSRTGIRWIPFDPHHVYSQVVGFLLAIVGLSWSWRD